jgi:hypothetical protein
LPNQADDRQLSHAERFAEVKRERGIVAQRLARSHERNIFRERDAIVRVVHPLCCYG